MGKETASRAKRIKTYLREHPAAKASEIAKAIGAKVSNPEQLKSFGVACSLARRDLGLSVTAGKSKGPYPAKSDAEMLQIGMAIVGEFGHDFGKTLRVLTLLANAGPIADVIRAVKQLAEKNGDTEQI